MIDKKHLWMIGMVFACLSKVSAQTPSSTQVDNLIPPSPEASAFGKYNQIPVSLYTGVPQIEVPLYTLTEGDISIPIQLSYHASGNRVDEIAPWTGLGWTLNGGGVISRTVVGKADEYGPEGFLRFSINNTPASIYTGTEQEKYDRWTRLTECADAEPDQFFFSLPGYSGRFAFNWNREISIASDRAVQIRPLNMTPGSLSFIGSWEVIGDDGTVYLFEAQETNQMVPQGLVTCPHTTPPVVSWYLTRITSPGGHAVYFTYQSYVMEYDLYTSGTINHKWGYQNASEGKSIVRTRIQGKYLSQITTSSGNTTVQFIQGTERRTDIPGSSANTLYSLKEIVVTNRNGQKVKHFRNTYDYRTGRLTLTSVQELPLNGTAALKPPHVFSYHSTTLPAFGTGPVEFRSQDHWGYMNNNTAATLIPPYRVFNPDGSVLVDFSGANRQPSNGSFAGILTQILYPTGGTTTFDYELHDYSFVGSEKLQKPAGYQNKNVSVLHSGSTTSNTGNAFTRSAVFHIKATVDDESTPADESAITFQAQIYKCDGFSAGVWVSLYKSTGERIGNWSVPDSEFNSGTLHLPEGDYFLEARASAHSCWVGGNQVWDFATMNMNWIESLPEMIRSRELAGGLRVKRITDYDGLNLANNIVRRFKYEMSELPAGGGPEILVSSGVISAKPKYEFNTFFLEGANAVPYTSRIASSIVVIGSTQGSHIGYRFVQVLQGENGENGKAESSYTSFFDHNDQISYQEPFPPPISYDFKRGLLMKQVEYKRESSSFVPVKETLFEYEFSDVNTDAFTLFGLKVGRRCQGCDVAYVQAESIFSLGGHSVILGISKVKTPTETLYENGQAFTTQKHYQYDANLHFLKKETIVNSEGKEIATAFTHPHDYPAGVSNSIMVEMKNRHMLSPVIEQVTTEKNGNDVRVIDASFTQFGLFSSSRILPYKQYQFSSASPVSDFMPSLSSTGNYDSRYYQEVSFIDGYTAQSRPEHVRGQGNVVTTYFWGHGGLFVTAIVNNATSEQCAFADFESLETGNWSYNQSGVQAVEFKTGRKSFAGTLTSMPLSTGRYVVSLYAKGSGSVTVNGISKPITGAWQRYEWVIANPSAISINSQGNWVDDVRLHPSTAHMKTMTHEPGIGMTSMTNENHEIIYYSYDEYGRLKNVMDMSGNIIRNYQYHFKGQ